MGQVRNLWALSVLAGCGPAPKTTLKDSVAAQRPAVAANPVPAESTLSYFLTVAVPTRRPSTVMIDSIVGCRDTENLDHVLWHAAWQIDSSVALGDSTLVYFRATSVARLRAADGGGYKAVLGVEEVPVVARLDRLGSHYTVCVNFRDPRHPADDFFIGGPFPNVRWTPSGASTAEAFAAIDSIRRVRGLPIIR